MSSFRTRSVQFFDVVARKGLLVFTTAAALLAGADVAYSGPCTAQIAALEQKIRANPPSPKSGPTFSQTLGAQLHYQPTPQDVEHAQQIAREQAEAALEAARKADAADNASACSATLDQVKRLYDIEQ